jgi:hypothetical protein
VVLRQHTEHRAERAPIVPAKFFERRGYVTRNSFVFISAGLIGHVLAGQDSDCLPQFFFGRATLRVRSLRGRVYNVVHCVEDVVRGKGKTNLGCCQFKTKGGIFSLLNDYDGFKSTCHESKREGR